MNAKEGKMAETKRDFETMLRAADHERGSDTQVNFRISPQWRALLFQTAREARCSQAGILRIGLQLAAAEVTKWRRAQRTTGREAA